MPQSARCQDTLGVLRSLGNPANVQGMAHFGISPENTLGVSMIDVRRMARQLGRDHDLAAELWGSGIHEARILAALVDNPKMVTPEQMESWVRDLDSWDVCDQLCSNLFDRTPFAYARAVEWSSRPEEFVKRAGFVLMAALAVHDKKAEDGRFLEFLPIIRREATDDRNFVKKAVNWALRQIGKRGLALNAAAIETAREIQQMDSRCARWIASDAIRELENPTIKMRLVGKVSD
jgi:3-methyladenine DNA glycosylase AlkD